MFQSTRPRGARPNDFAVVKRYEEVSIHAPARGATGKAGDPRTIGLCFNPRARAGRDAGSRRARRPRLCFNPRARAGRDFIRIRKTKNQKGFNPRARAGRDG